MKLIKKIQDHGLCTNLKGAKTYSIRLCCCLFGLNFSVMMKWQHPLVVHFDNIYSMTASLMTANHTASVQNKSKKLESSDYFGTLN